MSKAAQGFLPEAYFSTSRAETRGERRSSEKRPFMIENRLTYDTEHSILGHIITAAKINGLNRTVCRSRKGILHFHGL